MIRFLDRGCENSRKLRGILTLPRFRGGRYESRITGRKAVTQAIRIPYTGTNCSLLSRRCFLPFLCLRITLELPRRKERIEFCAMKVLLVEDDKHIVGFLKRGLEEEGYFVEVAYDGEMGLDLAQDGEFDLIILDILLPKIDGFAVCRRLRAAGNITPVLMLTAKDDVEDRVRGLDLGADDYLVKPFAFEELLARMRALIRRNKSAEGVILRVGDLTINLLTREVKRGERAIELTAREFELLKLLVHHPGRVFTRTQLLEHVWGYDFEYSSNIVDVYIRYLREKIDRPFDRKLIHTVRGVGYKLQP